MGAIYYILCMYGKIFKLVSNLKKNDLHKKNAACNAVITVLMDIMYTVEDE